MFFPAPASSGFSQVYCCAGSLSLDASQGVSTRLLSLRSLCSWACRIKGASAH